MADDDLFSNPGANILGRVSNRLRVLLDLRHRLKTDKDHPIVDLKTRATQRRLGHLIDQYKRLMRPSRRYFSKHGEELNMHDYQEFDGRLKNIAEAIQEENSAAEATRKGKGGRGRVVPGTNIIELGTHRVEQGADQAEQQTYTSMDRIQKFLDQCEIDFQELPIELQLAAIEYLMNQNETEFMTFINFIYHNLSQLRSELERRRKGAQAPTQAERNRELQQMQTMDSAAEAAGLEHEGLAEAPEKRDQPEAQPAKQMAFAKQLDKVNALMAKIEMAMGIQPKFNPKPYM